MKLVTKYPFSRDDVGTGRFGNELPGVVLQKGLMLRVHGSRPVRICQSLFVGARNWKRSG
jgi:hypothetical protein